MNVSGANGGNTLPTYDSMVQQRRQSDLSYAQMERQLSEDQISAKEQQHREAYSPISPSQRLPASIEQRMTTISKGVASAHNAQSQFMMPTSLPNFNLEESTKNL